MGEDLRLGEPVDLVGHAWGGGHVMGVAMTRPDLLRSWVCDVVGIFDPDYVWPDLAQLWQTPGRGDAAVDQIVATPVAGRAANLAARGITPEVAARGAEMLIRFWTSVPGCPTRRGRAGTCRSWSS